MSSERVLVVQRDEKASQTITAFFEARGDSVVTASSLEQANEIMKEEQPDIVALDAFLFGAKWTSAMYALHQRNPYTLILLTGEPNHRQARRWKDEIKQWRILHPPYTDERIMENRSNRG